MFNLLPESEKKQILSEYTVRRTVIALVFLFILGFIAVISVFPSYLLSVSKVRETEAEIGSIKRSAIFSEEKVLRAELLAANEKLSALTPAEQEAYAHSLFEKLISHKPSSIRLNGLSFKKNAEGNWLRVNGVAESRESLSTFVDTLRADPLFTEVDLPVASFAKDRNAEFSLEIQGAF